MSLHGGLITKRPLCYTSNGRLLLAPCGNAIRLYSARSGDHIATLRGHELEVTAVVQDPSNDDVVLTSSLDGTIRRWDVQEGTVLRSWNIGQPIECMVYSGSTGLAYVAVHHKGGQSGRVISYSLSTGEEQSGRLRTSRSVQLVISPSGHHVAALDKNSLFVWTAGSWTAAGRSKPLNLVHTKPYTCAAFNPTDSIIAAGDATGRILIWHNFPAALQEWASGASTAAAAVAATAAVGSNPGFNPRTPHDADVAGSVQGVKLPSCSTVHWHAHAVGAVCFSADGSYLMSGGQEGVLVQWSVPHAKRSYLPRLGGPLRGITTSPADPAKFLVSHTDNTIRLINMATTSVELSIHGLRPPPAAAAALAAAGYGTAASSSSSSPAGILLQPGSSTLVLPVDPTSLQFFDVNRDRHIARLQVSPRTPASLTEVYTNHSSAAAAGQSTAPLQPAVVLVAFTGNGRGLITVDVTPATAAYGPIPVESTLRFWDTISSTQTANAAAPYTLNTTADCPHQGLVSGLATHPQLDMAVTTGSDDGEFKIWTKSNRSGRRSVAAAAAGSSSSVVDHWRCSSVAGYKTLGLSGCTFSHDGSLLAVAAGAAATLWDPYNATLVKSLCCPAECTAASNGSSSSRLRQLVFIRNSLHLVGLVGGGDAAAALAAVGLDQEEQQQQQQRRGQQQQLAAAVQHSWGHAVVIWDLLSSSVVWYCSLPVCSLAADPIYPKFAVGVPAVIITAAAAGSGQQQQQQQGSEGQQQQGQEKKDVQRQQQQQHRQQQQGLVLVFSPTDPKPLLACPVPDSSPASLVFMPGSSRQQQQQRKVPVVDPSAGVMSPLLLLTDDRRYTKIMPAAVAAAGGSDGSDPDLQQQQQPDVPSGIRAAMEAERASGRDDSALEAMFGKFDQPAAAARKSSSAWAAAVEEAAAVNAAVAQLFDAPSHVLPAPTTLCPTLLEIMIGVGKR